MINEKDIQCRALCLTHQNRCSRKWSCKGFLCRQHYRLYGKLNDEKKINKLKIINFNI